MTSLPRGVMARLRGVFKSENIAPVLVAMLLPLIIAGQNVDEVSFIDVVFTLVLITSLTVFAVGVLRLFVRDSAKRSLVLICFLLLIYAYGHVYELFLTERTFEQSPGIRHRYCWTSAKWDGFGNREIRLV